MGVGGGGEGAQEVVCLVDACAVDDFEGWRKMRQTVGGLFFLSLSLSRYLSIYLSIYLYLYLSISITIYLSIHR